MQVVCLTQSRLRKFSQRWCIAALFGMMNSNVRESVQLDRDKKYIIAFLDKTRNDDDKIQVLYEFNGRYNRWREKGYCSVFNEHK